MTKKCFILSLPKFQTPYFVLYILQHGPSIQRERNLGMFPQCRAVIFGCWFPLAVKISLGNFSSEERNATKNTKTGLLQEMSREVIFFFCRWNMMFVLLPLLPLPLLPLIPLLLLHDSVVVASVQAPHGAHCLIFAPRLMCVMDRARKSGETMSFTLL